MSKYYMAIDQGTTGTTIMLVNADTLDVYDKYNQEFSQLFPKPSWVEHNLNEIWETIQNCTKNILRKNNIKVKDIISIGITNQRETTCAYDKAGVPLHNAIVWQDRRTTQYCNSKSADYAQHQKKTGLPLDPYFSATKMNWLLNNSNDVKEALENNDLHLSTIDTFLLFKLTKSFKTDTSNASRTLLMNLETCNWDADLLEFFDIPESVLPSIQDSISDFGTTSGLDFLPDGIPVQCILGDQQAALFGQAGQKEGALKATYGTGAFILLNTGNKISHSSNGLLTTVAYSYKGKHFYALEGSAYIAGAAVQWLRDNLNIIDSSNDIEKLAGGIKSTEETEHILFMPFFTGIGSPYWKPDAKAAIIGLTRDSSKAHIAMACLEGIALSVNDSIESMTSDFPGSVNEIRVDGGASLNNILMQLQSDFSNKKIIRPKVIDTTAYGVALGCAIGQNKIGIDQIESFWKKDRHFDARPSDYHQKKSTMWKKTIQALF